VKRPLTKMLLLCLFLITSCSSDTTSNNSNAGLWTWMSGDNSTSQSGSYGTRGTPSPSNKPGARYGSASWTDNSGKMWLFGGYGYAGGSVSGPLNDLWSWDGTSWTWQAGDSVTDQMAVYGAKGIAAATNKPSARQDAISWVDASGNLWLFGGLGYDVNGVWSQLNDLWRWDGTNWTWISGDTVSATAGIYGTKGAVTAANKPGARSGAVTWSDRTGNLWLFGGLGYDENGGWGDLNDLWRWDGTNWTWISGDNVINQPGEYGSKGSPTTANKPGSRQFAVSWMDRSGNFWLFGGSGTGKSGAGNSGYLNDLWKWDGTNWTWIAGDDAPSNSAVYGTKGVAAPTNKIGGRLSAVSWADASGNFWIFGGRGTDGSGVSGSSLNDLWRWDGTNWTWMAGETLNSQSGVYGIKGTAATANTPGARYGVVSWADSSGNLWLFGGNGYSNSSFPGYLNDLWRYR